jgi:hypothetical protein
MICAVLAAHLLLRSRQQATMAQDSVTQQTAAADRMRRMRARRKSAPSQPLLFERADWKLFLDPQSLPQKAGCEPHQIGRVVLKELVDNALDAGAGAVTLTGNACRCVIADGGPGIDPAQLPKLFAVNRPLLSSKLKRLPTRGMLGNGLRVVMGAVAALNGAINVTTRGQRYRLDIDRFAGTTRMEPMTAAPDVQGLRVELHFPQPLFESGDFNFARMAIQLAGSGYSHAGASLPGWYSPTALCDLLAAAPQEVPPSEVISDVFGITAAVTKPSERWAAAFINQAPRHPDPRIGEIGSDAIDGEYSARTGTVEINGAQIPYCVEAWVSAEMAGKDDNTRIALHPLLNRSPTLALLYGHADSTGLRLQGCGIDVKVNGPKRADYRIFLSLITPYLRLTGDGKAPFLGDFQAAIATVLKDAATQAYRSLVRPAASISVADAAALVMCAAYSAVGNYDDRQKIFPRRRLNLRRAVCRPNCRLRSI